MVLFHVLLCANKVIRKEFGWYPLGVLGSEEGSRAKCEYHPDCERHVKDTVLVIQLSREGKAPAIHALVRKSCSG